MTYINSLVQGVENHKDELDAHIERLAKNWSVSRISRTAVAVLRAALFEILYMDEVPASAAINEAVELAKGYDEPEIVAFINGILGSFMREASPDPDDDGADTPEPDDGDAGEVEPDGQ
jgi:N utilization substance protein B